MIFAVPRHIEYIRNGLYISIADREGVPARVVKTQTRRLNRGIYQVGKDYAVQPKRGVKAVPGIRIVMDRIWEEKDTLPNNIFYVTKLQARAEGGYTPEEFEKLFRDLNPKWDGRSRWAFAFHVVGVQNKCP